MHSLVLQYCTRFSMFDLEDAFGPVVSKNSVASDQTWDLQFGMSRLPFRSRPKQSNAPTLASRMHLCQVQFQSLQTESIALVSTYLLAIACCCLH